MLIREELGNVRGMTWGVKIPDKDERSRNGKRRVGRLKTVDEWPETEVDDGSYRRQTNRLVWLE
jgi:hypothetical protein